MSEFTVTVLHCTYKKKYTIIDNIIDCTNNNITPSDKSIQIKTFTVIKAYCFLTIQIITFIHYFSLQKEVLQN